MSTATIAPASGDFDDLANFLEFAVIVRDFDRNDLDAEQPERTYRTRGSRGDEDRRAIQRSLGYRRHRTGEREV